MDSLAALTARLGHEFTDSSLLRQALTHPSVGKTTGKKGQGKSSPHYERLEFLGDRVLGLVIATMLYEHFPNEVEGDMARRHTALVRRDALAVVAEQWGVGACLILSKGEDECGGRTNPGNLADATEAILGAIYLDGGFNVVSDVIRRAWTPLMDRSLNPPRDAKTSLQEWSQKHNHGQLPVYSVEATSGPSHNPFFTVRVRVGSWDAVGDGPSKRLAEQAAAQSLLQKVTET